MQTPITAALNVNDDGRHRLVYITDTYCVWCWAFGPAVREFAQQETARLTVQVIPAGMLVADRVVAVRDKPRVLEGAQRVTALTGVAFGDGFREAVAEGSTILDSTAAGIAMMALRHQSWDSLDLAHALQWAWYDKGWDLRRPEVVGDVARHLGLDATWAMRDIADPATRDEALAQFALRKTFDIKGYPSLLMETVDGWKRVGGALATPEKLSEGVDAILRGEQIPDDEDD